MTSQNKPRWYSGHDILKQGIQGFELLDAVKAGKLTPYNKESGRKVIDLETAERMMTPDEIEKIWRHGESYKIYHNEDPAGVVKCHKDFDVEFDGFELQRVLDYIYKADEVRAFSDDKPNVRKAVALEVAKSVKKNHPKFTQIEAAKEINEQLRTNYQYEPYSQKHLIRIISDLGFKAGKRGRKPNK